MSLETIVVVQWVFIAFLVGVIAFLMGKLEKLVPEGVVKSLLETVKQPLLASVDSVLTNADSVAKLTETQLDDIAVSIGKSVLAGLRRDMNANDMVVAQSDAKSAPTTVIVVNGREKVVPMNDFIFYEEVIRLAFDNPPANSDGISVIYTRGDKSKPSGTLTRGQSVKIKGGMVFDAVSTSNA